MKEMMVLRCARCAKVYPFNPCRFRCDCEGPLELGGAPIFDPAQVEPGRPGLWRYRHALPLPEGTVPITLGEGLTPLVAAEWDGLPVHLKCEFLNPTGSFKDRGTAVLVSALAAAGVARVVEDSSGNAGASLAAYAARAGLQAAVYVPAHASPVKRAQIAAYGAEVRPVPGPRSESARAALAAVGETTAYASHVYHPLVHHGMKTAAFEIVEQVRLLTGRAHVAPDAVILPVGHGTLLLGLALGFAELRTVGWIERLPRLFGVQAASCAPLAAAWERGAEEPQPQAEGETVAEGVRIAAPLRGREVLAAVRGSGGGLLALPDDQTLEAQRRLARRGFYVEPTSALAVAALDLLRERLTGVVVVVLTGSGFKTPL